MTEDFLYHYTSFDGFKAILESKSIRFTRLDYLEDVYEGHSEFQPQAKSTVFVSCWVGTNEELIPHWKIYANLKEGVRIRLPRNMFGRLPRDVSGENIDIGYDSLFKTTAELSGSHKVEYVLKLPEPVSRTETSDNLEFCSLGKQKLKQWEFEKEERFIVCPSGSMEDLTRTYNPNSTHPGTIFNNETVKYLYIPVQTEIFSQMQVTYGYHAPEKLINEIQQLCREYKLKNPPEKSGLNLRKC